MVTETSIYKNDDDNNYDNNDVVPTNNGINVSVIKEFGQIQNTYISFQQYMLTQFDNNKTYIDAIFKLQQIIVLYKSIAKKLATVCLSDNTAAEIDTNVLKNLGQMHNFEFYTILNMTNQLHTNENNLMVVDSDLSKISTGTVGIIDPHLLIETVSFNYHNNDDGDHNNDGSMSVNIKRYTEVYEAFVEYGNLVNIEHLSDFKYHIELNQLIDLPTPVMNNDVDFTINRYNCAGIVAKSMFLNNIKGVDLKTLTNLALLSPFLLMKATAASSLSPALLSSQSEEQLLKIKLLSILEYLFSVCKLMRENYEYFNNNIEVRSIRTFVYQRGDFKTSSKPINFGKIKISKQLEISGEFDLTVCYSRGKLSDNLFDASYSQKAINCLECTEMYAVVHYFDRPLANHETLLINKLVKYNSVTTTMLNKLEYKGNMLSDEGINIKNLLIIQNEKSGRNDNANDHESYLDSRLDKLANGVSEHLKQIKNNNNNNIKMYSGSYDTVQNCAFQFIVECLVATQFGISLDYCVKNSSGCISSGDNELYDELVNTIIAIQKSNLNTVGKLYNKLLTYDHNSIGPYNFGK
ncbi:Poly (ADP-ribose) glycohydrolase [Trabala vishnou gigantina nucleopolyhedrovirus]|uniref:Poly (ADP-ribose) glycohydrolase n=1 Tax=Trabala vishnou gigantina nucleopolyhedrovirus TaxID=2863583 RepID=UPI0024819AF6|nr:Poly (ADP-ribose) glycohydrolase [Trabala vishnou gigantina nucleopolyhedrovirus]QYC92665.1 Poly (ADP-ribose) glycohydrolase [Trabala vishnou gigantina nucleopolyhedrovirus]